MATIADGGDSNNEQTRNCPDCGAECDYDIITEHGTRFETTAYMGWWCKNCGKGMTECEHCDSLHHPDHRCELQRKAEFEQARDTYDQTARISGIGTVPLDDCEIHGVGTTVYVEEGGCPKCGGDIVHRLNPDTDNTRFPADYQFKSIVHSCDEDDCQYQKP